MGKQHALWPTSITGIGQARLLMPAVNPNLLRKIYIEQVLHTPLYFYFIVNSSKPRTRVCIDKAKDISWASSFPSETSQK